eukprot:Gregarina_sp_Poly_1__8384@NODE_491_length_7964_cov_12_375332_g395_i0_p4_GENE_NODE_491_length_7964_cov_12_375332_g395_i0NODE_491_length_7964_cov_12_375332_g395_i0_p4_ORF_typecomplete_len215_score24_17SPO22/PF08631_10/0_025_NODE_491_length_7964_cov_12_375332_g395_i053986042
MRQKLHSEKFHNVLLKLHAEHYLQVSLLEWLQNCSKARVLRCKGWEVLVSIASRLHLIKAYLYCLEVLIQCHLSNNTTAPATIMPLFRELVSHAPSKQESLQSVSRYADYIKVQVSTNLIAEEVLWLLGTAWNNGCSYLRIHNIECAQEWMALAMSLIPVMKEVLQNGQEEGADNASGTSRLDDGLVLGNFSAYEKMMHSVFASVSPQTMRCRE